MKQDKKLYICRNGDVQPIYLLIDNKTSKILKRGDETEIYIYLKELHNISFEDMQKFIDKGHIRINNNLYLFGEV